MKSASSFEAAPLLGPRPLSRDRVPWILCFPFLGRARFTRAVSSRILRAAVFLGTASPFASQAFTFASHACLNHLGYFLFDPPLFRLS